MRVELKLRQGRFYVAKNGYVWCCYVIRNLVEEHAQAYCIRLVDHKIEYFYLDGRYDTKDTREHSLLREVELDEYEDGLIPDRVDD